MIIKRNAEGEVRVNGKLFAKVPATTSMLCSLENREGDYREDGYRYDLKTGERGGKWFSYVSETKVWGPKLEDIPKLEDLWHRCKGHTERAHKRLWLSTFQAILKAGRKAHCEPTHWNAGDGKWWLYHISNDRGMGEGIGFDWVDKPTKPLNLELGNAFYRADRLMTDKYGRQGKAERVFLSACNGLIGEWAMEQRRNGNKRVDVESTDFFLTMNGREHWFRHSPRDGTSYNGELLEKAVRITL